MAELSSTFASRMNNLLRDPTDDVDRDIAKMRGFWKEMIEDNDSSEQREYSVYGVFAKMNLMIRSNSPVLKIAPCRIGAIVSTMIDLIRESEHPYRALIAVVNELSRYYTPLWTKQFEELAETFTMDRKGLAEEFLKLEEVVPEYYSLVEKITRNSYTRLILMKSSINAEIDNFPIVATVTRPFGLYAFLIDRICFNPIHPRHKLELVPYGKDGWYNWVINKSIPLHPDPSSPSKMVTYGHGPVKYPVRLPSEIREVVEAFYL